MKRALACLTALLWGAVLASGDVAPAYTPTNAREQFAVDLLARLGNPAPSADTVAFVVSWTMAEDVGEGALARHNPLNTTQASAADTMVINSDGVKGYATYEDGLDATVRTLTNGYYDALVAALVANDPSAALAALVASPWASSHYGGGAGWPQYRIQGDARCGFTDTMEVGEGSAFWSTGSSAWSGQYGGLHLGTDMVGSRGDPVYTPWPITIDGDGQGIGYYDDAGRKGSYIQAHLDNGYLIYFGHLIDVYVQPGERVEACQQIGTLGATDWPHTHVKMASPSAPIPCEGSAPGPSGCIDPIEYWETH